MNKEGKLVWITGLAGAGKTTIAKSVYQELKRIDNATILLDGDDMRKILGESNAHDIESRKRTARVYASLSRHMTYQGINVVMSTISLFHEIHNYNRKHNQNYLEVILDVSPRELVRRNKKGLYNSAANNVMGRHQKPEFPKNPDLVLKNDNLEQLNANVQSILSALKK